MENDVSHMQHLGRRVDRITQGLRGESREAPASLLPGGMDVLAALEHRIGPACPDQWCQANLSEADEDLSVA